METSFQFAREGPLVLDFGNGVGIALDHLAGGIVGGGDQLADDLHGDSHLGTLDRRRDHVAPFDADESRFNLFARLLTLGDGTVEAFIDLVRKQVLQRLAVAVGKSHDDHFIGGTRTIDELLRAEGLVGVIDLAQGGIQLRRRRRKIVDLLVAVVDRSGHYVGRRCRCCAPRQRDHLAVVARRRHRPFRIPATCPLAEHASQIEEDQCGDNQEKQGDDTVCAHFVSWPLALNFLLRFPYSRDLNIIQTNETREIPMPAVVPLIILLAFPVLEIATFVYVGQWLGVWRTVGLVVLAAVVGVAILRYQGLGALKKIDKDLRRAQPPAANIVDGFMIVIASFLLIIPGFVSDVIGLLLIVPPIRHLVWRLLGRSINVSYSSSFRRSRRRDDFVDLSPDDFRRQDEPRASSPRLQEPD